jgi:hypothetical protein
MGQPAQPGPDTRAWDRAGVPPPPAPQLPLPPPRPGPPIHPVRRSRTAAIVAAATVAFVVVAGATGTATYLLASNPDEEAADAGAAAPLPSPAPLPSSASPSPPAAELTAAELYHTSPWPYDITFDNGNRIQGELELIDSYDHPDCRSAARTEAAELALVACTHRVEAAYRGTVEGSVVSEQVLIFTDADVAARFRGQFEELHAGEIISFQDPGEIQAVGSTIGWVDDAVDRYVILGMVFGPELPQQSVDDLAARNEETVDYLRTRGS